MSMGKRRGDQTEEHKHGNDTDITNVMAGSSFLAIFEFESSYL